METRTPWVSLVVMGCVLAPLGILFAGNGPVNVTQHHNHASRDGLYADPSFTPSAAAALTRDLAFGGSVTGNVYAQPLYIEGGAGGKAMVIAVTEANNVYALDATNGSIIWNANVGRPAPSGSLHCGNIGPYGITGTPVVDLPTRALFFDAVMMATNPVTMSVSPGHFIFSMNVDTGTVNPGWPVNVDTNVAFGSTAFSTLTQGERGALVIVGANLYVPYGGLAGDCGPFYGWVVGVPLNNPTNLMAWATSAQGGGVWAVNGVSSDGTDVFVATGNTYTSGEWGCGEAVLHLLPNLALTNGANNYWAPLNWYTLDGSDLDLGSSGALLVDVPGATPSALVAAFGKDGNVYLLNRTNLGGISSPLAQQQVASGSIVQAAAAYQTSKGTYLAYVYSGSVCALRIGANNPPTITNVWRGSVSSGRFSPFVTSTDGSNNVIVWSIGGDQRLRAFDGDTGTNIFTGGGANELMTTGVPTFNTGIAARGRIYVGATNRVYAFQTPPLPVAPIRLGSLSILPSGAFQFAFTNTPGLSFSVFGTTNLSSSFMNWTPLGSATEVSPGQFQFTDPQATSNLDRFYRVSSP